MNQILQINLASPQSTAYQNFKEIREAVYNASLRLYSKHGVQIKDVQTVGEQVLSSKLNTASSVTLKQVFYSA